MDQIKKIKNCLFLFYILALFLLPAVVSAEPQLPECYRRVSGGYALADCSDYTGTNPRLQANNCYVLEARPQGTFASRVSCQEARDNTTQDPGEEAASPTGRGGNCNTSGELNSDNCTIIRYLSQLIKVLSAAAGIVATIMIVWGGIMYASARDNPQQAASAKNHIRDVLIGLVGYIFFVAVLNWIVPGGVF